MGFWWTLERQNDHMGDPRSRKRVPKGDFGVSLGSLLMPKLQYWHLTKTCIFTPYLTYNPCLGSHDAVRNASLGQISCRAGQLMPFLTFLCPTWWTGGPKVSAKGLPRAPKGDPKIVKNRSKIHSGVPWDAQGCQGVPPRCPKCSKMNQITRKLMQNCIYVCSKLNPLQSRILEKINTHSYAGPE